MTANLLLAVLIGFAAAVLMLLLRLPRWPSIVISLVIGLGAGLLVFGMGSMAEPGVIPGRGVHTIAPPSWGVR